MDEDARTRHIEAIVDAVLTAPDLKARWNGLTQGLAALGIDQVNYAFLNLAAAERMQAEVHFVTTMRDEWISHYGESRLDLDDPHVKLLRGGNLQPYLWTEQDNNRINDKGELNVVDLAAAEGLKNHLQITLPDFGRFAAPVAGLLFGSSQTERDFLGSIKGLEPSLVMLGHLFHNASIGEMKRVTHGVRPLSPRERDCLTWLAKGLRVDGVADKLGLARVTVELYLRNARRKLKARTLHEALARAVLWREI